MFLVGYIGAPPTMTVIAAKTGAAAKGAAKARPAASSVARRVILAFMFGSVVIFSSHPFERDVKATERDAKGFRPQKKSLPASRRNSDREARPNGQFGIS